MKKKSTLPPSTPTDGDRQALIALYQATWDEIARLRDYEWKLAYYFISLAVGQIALLTVDRVNALLTPTHRGVLTVVQFAAIAFSAIYLETTHGYLTQQRNIRRAIEETLGFYDPLPGRREPLLPKEWKGKRIERKFQRLGLLVPLETMVFAVQIAALYLTWRL